MYTFSLCLSRSYIIVMGNCVTFLWHVWCVSCSSCKYIPSLYCQTSFTVLLMYWSGFLYQGLIAIFAYLSLNVKPCCNNSDGLSVSCMFGAILGRVLQELDLVSTSAGWLVVNSFSWHCCTFYHPKSGRNSSLKKNWRVKFQFLGCLQGLWDIIFLYWHFWIYHL